MSARRSGSTGRPRRRIGRIIGWTALVVGAVLVLAGAGLWFWKPWAPAFVVAEPGPGGERVTIGDDVANSYPAQGATGDAPAVLVLGGSEGGISPLVDQQARLLSEAGMHALALSYFGGPGQSRTMSELPLEDFDAALTWLARQPGVDAGRLGLLGASKGAEAALLVASAHPELRAVVAYVPSSVVWQGIDLVEPWKTTSVGSTWSRDGAPLPHVPYPSDVSPSDVLGMYTAGLASADSHPGTAIPVGDITAPLLLVCGAQDGLWPSCAMSRSIERSVAEAGGPPVTVLEYPEAGHFAGGAPADPDDPDYELLGSLGGSPASNAAARADGWPRTIEHFASAFAA